MGGCTHNSTRTLVRQAEQLKHIPGVDGRALCHPYYNKPSQEGQFQHFSRWPAPSIRSHNALQHSRPHRGQSRTRTVLRLAEAAPNIQAIKESSGKLPQIARLVHILPDGFKSSAATTTSHWLHRSRRARTRQRPANEIPAEMGA